MVDTTPWWAHFWHLAGQSGKILLDWNSATPFSLVREVCIPILILVCMLGFTMREWRLPKSKELIRAALSTVIVILATLVLTWLAAFPFAVYRDHEALAESGHRFVATVAQDTQQISNLRTEIEWRKRVFDRNSPLFSNTVNLINAFAGFSDRTKTLTGNDCQIDITAPEGDAVLAGTIYLLIFRPSRCNARGPGFSDPSSEARETGGMKDGYIVFHHNKEDPAGRDLYNDLSGLLPLKESWDIPLGKSEHYVWLQFGHDVKWTMNEEVKQ